MSENTEEPAHHSPYFMRQSFLHHWFDIKFKDRFIEILLEEGIGKEEAQKLAETEFDPKMCAVDVVFLAQSLKKNRR